MTVFITNGLFMALKLNDTQTTTSTDKNIFLSAYLTRRIQYNDVDPDKMIEPDKVVELVDNEETNILKPDNQV